MADLPISGLPAGAPATAGTMVTVQAGTTVKISATAAGAAMLEAANAAAQAVLLGFTTVGAVGKLITAFTTMAAGGLLYASALDTPATLAPGTNGHILTMVAGAPAWAANAGTIGGTAASGELAYGSGVNTLTSSATFTILGNALTAAASAANASVSLAAINSAGAGAATLAEVSASGNGSRKALIRTYGSSNTDTIAGTAAASSVAVGATGGPTNVFIGSIDGLGTPTVRFVTAGVEAFRYTSTAVTSAVPIRGPDGAAGAPTFGPASDPTTGLWFFGSTNYFSSGGTIIMRVGATEVSFDVAMRGAGGTAAVPMFSGYGDPDTGWYLSAANTYSITTGGTLRFSVSTTAITSTLPYVGAASSAAATFYQGLSAGTGIFFGGGAVMSLAAASTEHLQLTGTRLDAFVPLTIAPPTNVFAVPAFRITPAAHVQIVATTESNTLLVDTVSQQWLAGTTVAQRSILFTAQTLTGQAATATFTDSATVAITGAPIIGANAAATNTPSALWIQSGQTRFDGPISCQTASATGIVFSGATNVTIGHSGAFSLILQTNGISALTFDSARDGTFSGNLTFADAKNFIFNTSTGSIIAAAANQKIAVWGATPIVQPASANQAALTNSTGGAYDGTLVDVATIGVADPAKINDNFTDVFTLLTAIRTAMVNFGSMKGAA